MGLPFWSPKELIIISQMFKISEMKTSAGTIWSDSAGFADAYTPPPARAPPGAPGPWQKRYDIFKKTRRGGEWKQLPPWKKKSLCFTSLSYNDSFRDSLCARDKDTLTLSASVTDATNGCWRGVATAKRPAPLVHVLICVCEILGWLGLLCVTWCLEAFMIMNARSSPTKTYQ